MVLKRLGRSELQISQIGLGAWAIGGDGWIHGWGPQSEEDSIVTILRAMDAGINWIDTAPVYGLGHSERVVGKALQGVAPSDRPLVFTKCSLRWDDRGRVEHNLRPESIRAEAEGSLRRLGVDRLDLYQIHWAIWPTSPREHDPGSFDDAWLTLKALQQEGKVRSIGVSNSSVNDLRRIATIRQPCSLQVPYSLLSREIELETLPFCETHDIGVLAYSPLQSGLLSGSVTRERLSTLPIGDWRRRSRFFREPLLSRGLAVVDDLRAVAEREGYTTGQVAVAWILRQSAITGSIVGAHTPLQVDEIARAATIRLSEEDVERLNSLSAVSNVDVG